MEYRLSIEHVLRISISERMMLVVLIKLEIGSIEFQCTLSNKYRSTVPQILRIGSNEMKIFYKFSRML